MATRRRIAGWCGHCAGAAIDVLFLERDTPWYRDHRDLPQPPFGMTRLYDSVAELRERWSGALRDADLAIVGSYVPDGIEVAERVQRTAGGLVAFYDIDTPVTLAALAAETLPLPGGRADPRL